MSWALLAASVVGAALVVNAYRPFRTTWLGPISFFLAWPFLEGPIHVLLVDAGVTAWLVAEGALHAWPGRVGLVLTVVQAGWIVALAVAASRSGPVVRDALAAATRAGEPSPVGLGPDGVPELGRPVWNRSWRLALAVPLRFRGIRRIRNVDYRGDGRSRHRLDVIRLRGAEPHDSPVLVYIHGGAWIIGDKRQQGIPMMHELVRNGWICVSINYRIGRRATWPDHVVDCKRAIAWVREHIAEYGGDPTFLAVSGGSAGGHLAALVALTAGDPEYQQGFEEADTSVDAAVPFYGVYDMTGRDWGTPQIGREFVEFLEGWVFRTTQAENPEVFEAASPVFRVHAGAPPMFVIHGEHDSLVPVGVAHAFVDALRRESRQTVAYAELPLAQHAFDVVASVRCRNALMAAMAFLDAERARAKGDEPAAGVAGAHGG